MADNYKQIRLPCTVASNDCLIVEERGGRRTGVEITALVGDEHNTIFLNPEHARELFNWLGVYLHTVSGD